LKNVETLRAAFVAKARAKFGDRYDLSRVAYGGTYRRVTIVCPSHGAFRRKPADFLASSDGCPACCHERAVAATRKTPEQKAATRKAYVEAHRKLYSDAANRSRQKMRHERPEAFAAQMAHQAAYGARWRRTPEGKRKTTAIRHRRRARLRGAVPRLTREEWEAICHEHEGGDGVVRCAYCGKACEPTIDHLVPLSRGGQHIASNVKPACLSCNSSKGARLVSEWAGGAAYVAQSGAQTR
jgi:5-methylcytosine-specific restriction endonuclease McrA